jgi:ABC-type Fe3+-hydroxamate transport system substrate-binding protein
MLVGLISVLPGVAENYEGVAELQPQVILAGAPGAAFDEGQPGAPRVSLHGDFREAAQRGGPPS